MKTKNTLNEIKKDISERIDSLQIVVDNIESGEWSDRYKTKTALLRDLTYQKGFLDGLKLVLKDIEYFENKRV